MKVLFAKEQLSTLRRPRFQTLAGLLTAVYFITLVLLPNYRLVFLTLSSTRTLLLKLQFLQVLFLGGLHTYSLLQLFIFTATAVLVGLNGSLAVLALRRIPRESHLFFGGQSLIGLAAAGCSSCGTSLLSVVAASLGIGILPFQIQLLQIGVLLFLVFSFFKSLTTQAYCVVTSGR